MTVTVVYGQDPPLDLHFEVYRGGFWRADLNWLDADGNPVQVADKQISFRCEKSSLGDPDLVYPPDLDSTLDPVPPLDTADYLHLADGRVEIGLTSDTTKLLNFSSAAYRMFLSTDNVPELWARGRIRLVI